MKRLRITTVLLLLITAALGLFDVKGRIGN